MLIIVTLNGLAFNIAAFIIIAFNIVAFGVHQILWSIQNCCISFTCVDIPSIYFRRFEPKMPEVAKKNPQQERDVAAIKVDATFLFYPMFLYCFGSLI